MSAEDRGGSLHDSSCGTSRWCRAMFQRCPNGSSSCPCRSPQNMSASGWRTAAPAAIAWANTLRRRRHRGPGRRASADGRGREHAHLRELVGDVQHAVADAQPDRHEPPVGRWDPVELLGAERVPVEGCGALGALNDDVRGDDHRATVLPRPASSWTFLPIKVLPDGDRAVRMWRPPTKTGSSCWPGRRPPTRCSREASTSSGSSPASRCAPRGREQRLVLPGQLVAWDPSDAHAGAAVDGRPWTSRLMVVEVAGLAALAGDAEAGLITT